MIGAVVLAAGRSRRMGAPKMLLPWGDAAIIERVVGVLAEAGVGEIVVVTGGTHEQVAKVLEKRPLRIARNENYEQGEMLSSVQVGLRQFISGGGTEGWESRVAKGEEAGWESRVAKGEEAGWESRPTREVEAILICLGDQPQIDVQVVRGIMQVYRETGAQLVAPSYHQRRGHPWLVERSLWAEVLSLRPPATLRDFLREHASEIHYLNVDTSSVLADVDTLQDYSSQRPVG
jgi:molybdenum cofactor cytidylyltransferase